ncbi:carbohydrate porin [Martelella alba]|uniref:Carbohydrate porin n=1 Tax=Martelella alba TaxID=2590451 RepID=A0ABY2SK03_9HYPH|nr:carbohydrate porin [Martelella alba]TKI05358.1 carbohydrate porin [Martelella alba]
MHNGRYGGYGGYGGYLYLLQQVTAVKDNPRRGLSLFWHMSLNDRNTATMDYQSQIGAIYKGPFASRPRDFVGLGFSKMHINGSVAKRYRLLNEGKGIEDDTNPAYSPVRSAEYVTELNHNVAITPWFTLRPNVQLLAHPGGAENVKDAWVFSTQVMLRF